MSKGHFIRCDHWRLQGNPGLVACTKDTIDEMRRITSERGIFGANAPKPLPILPRVTHHACPGMARRAVRAKVPDRYSEHLSPCPAFGPMQGEKPRPQRQLGRGVFMSKHFGLEGGKLVRERAVLFDEASPFLGGFPSTVGIRSAH